MQNIYKQSDEETKYISQLEMLSIFYWVLGGLGLFASFFLFIYGFILGVVFFNDLMRDVMGVIGSNLVNWIAIIYLTVFLLVLALAILQIILGFKLNNRKHRAFSIFVACMSLIAFPFGTILGIYTLISLNNPIVKELYFKEMEINFKKTGL